jgi:hypothetical protein
MDLDPSITPCAAELEAELAANGRCAEPDDTFDVPLCGPAAGQVDAAVCGSPGSSCLVHANERVAAVQPSAISIDVDSELRPHIVLSQQAAMGSPTLGHVVREADGSWTALATTVSGGFFTRIAIGGDDTIDLLLYDDGGDTTAWRLTAGAWSMGDRLPADHFAAPLRGLLRSEAGCLHTAMMWSTAGTEEPKYVLHSGDAWTSFAVPTLRATVPIPPTIAIAPDGRPVLAYWAAAAAGRTLLMVAAGGRPETVTHEPGFGFFPDPTPVAVVRDADGERIHVIYNRTASSVNPGTLIDATRTTGGEWTHVPIDEVGRPLEADCPPPTAGARCDFVEMLETHPQAIVSSVRGEVRVLYVALAGRGTLIGSCMDGACSWAVESRNPYGTELRMAAIRGESVTVETLPVDAPREAAAVLDATGTLHIAVLREDGSGGTALQYVRLGL